MTGGSDPFARFQSDQGFLVLDGGMATELEARGCDLTDPLWSAKALIEAPDLILDVHRAFLEAGADCISTATYQASLEGFGARGLGPEESTELLRLGVRLAIEARDAFWSEPSNRVGRLEPLVAMSLGPYGAFLADGSEYRGDYAASRADLRSFHAARWDLMRESGADLTAWETVPSRVEAGVLRSLLEEHRDAPAWISFSCRDGYRIADGTPLVEVALDLAAVPNLCALGVNCTDARFVASLTCEAKVGSPKPILVYPNCGGPFDAESKTWVEPARPPDWTDLVPTWRAGGAFGIGGCCRVGPADIRSIRRLLTHA